MAIKDMPKRDVTNLYKALDFAIANAEDLGFERQVFKEIKNKIEEAMVKACVESAPDTFALFEHDGKLKVNLVETVKAWGYVQLPNGRWTQPLTVLEGGRP